MHFGYFDAGACADPLHRLHEVEPEALLHEGEDVSLLVAHEAVVAATRRHGEVVVRSLMEGTGPPIAVADALELHEFADDLHDVGFLANSVNDVVGNHQNSATVTPVPPSLYAPSRKLCTRLSFCNISATRSRSAPVPLP